MKIQLLVSVAALVAFCGCGGDDGGGGGRCEDRYFDSGAVEPRIAPAGRGGGLLKPLTSPPPLPFLDVRSPEDSSVVLTWPTAIDLCSGDRATHYEVRYAESSGSIASWNEMERLPDMIADAGNDENLLRIPGLIPHTNYDFQFRAFYSEDRSELSFVARATTTLCVGTAPPASHVFTRSWDLPAGSEPSDVEADLDGRVYVADRKASRVLIYSKEGVLQSSWGERGTGPGQLGSISDLIFGHDELLYVAEDSGRLQRFTPDGQFLLEVIPAWSGDRPDHLYDEFAVDEGGNVFVSNSLQDNLYRYRADGLFLGSWLTEGSRRPASLRFGPIALGLKAQVFVLDAPTGNVRVYSFTGGPLQTWPNSSRCPAPLVEPVDLRWGWDDNVYLLDAWNGQVRRLDADGKLLSFWGRIGTGAGEFRQPRALAVGRGLSLFVLDQLPTSNPSYRILVFEKQSGG